MGKVNILKRLFTPLPFLIFLLSQCKSIEEENKVIEFYISPDFKNYKVEIVALLPMANDNTSSMGTFYSTNHFYNNLSEINQYKLVDIDKIISSDSSAITEQLISIKEKSRINLDSFYATSLGQFLKTQNCNAIILGDVNYYQHSNDLFFRFGMLFKNAVTECNFNYFMISLHDGSLLWKAGIDGFSYNVYKIFSPVTDDSFPPLDEAISNGIDALLRKLEKEINLESKRN